MMKNRESSCLFEETVRFCDAISPPIFYTSTFNGGREYSYTRCSNPTRHELCRELALLEHSRYAFAFSSGLAAINALFSLLKQGDRVIVSDDLYGGTYRLITEIYTHYGIEFVFVDMSDLDLVKNEISRGARLLFAETPTNPMMKVADIRAISALCREKDTLFAVDNTFLTPYFQNPILLGADISVHSATKYLSGHHDCIAGAIMTDNDDIARRLELISMTLGNALDPFSSWILLRGLRTLPLRMEKHEENARFIAGFLKTLPEVERVYYPALPECGGHTVCKTQARGFGGVVTFTLRDDKKVKRLLKGGRIIRFAESLGGFCSLITYPITQTHSSVPRELREKIGITDKLLRLSLGLEDKEDIKNDILYMLGDCR